GAGGKYPSGAFFILSKQGGRNGMRFQNVALLYLLSSGLAAVGCVDDPRDPKTWIKKLDDPREKHEAVLQLTKLNDPEAVPALINLYKRSKDPNHLKAVAHFKDKRSIDVMIEALDGYSEESFDGAAVAANALGELGDPKAVDPLMKALGKPLPVKTRANIV